MSNITAINLIAITANGIEVYSHPAGHPHRPDLLVETINKITLEKSKTFHRETVDLGRTIGKDHLVETTDEDHIVYLRRGNRPGETRMVIKEASDTSFVTIILCVASKDNETPDELVGKWVVVTLFEGQPGKREPWDNAFVDADIDIGVAAEKERAESFWAAHALVPTEDEMKQIRKGDAVFVIRKNHRYGIWLCQKEAEFASLSMAVSAAEILAEEEAAIVTVCACFPGFGVPVKYVQ